MATLDQPELSTMIFPVLTAPSSTAKATRGCHLVGAKIETELPCPLLSDVIRIMKSRSDAQ